MKNIFKQTIMAVAALLMVVASNDAAVFTNLYNFKALGYDSATGYFTNNGGANPYAGLVLSSNAFYGTAYLGGSGGNGTIFKIYTDGTGFTNLHDFSTPIFGTNYDGVKSLANLVLSSNVLYGTTFGGGLGGNGTIFKINTDGTGFTNLYSFSANSGSPYYTNGDGASISSDLTFASNTLYGTAEIGGSANNGTIFKINADGSSFTNLHNFTAIINATNGDGANPQTGLAQSGNALYGTTQNGGTGGDGVIFKINTDGTSFTNLYSFSALSNNTNNDGSGPVADLALTGSILYGTTQSGGTGGVGTIFRINTDGTGFTNLYSFSAIINNTNNDGANPTALLELSGNILYGTTQLGGVGGAGTLFKINNDGTGFTNLYSFTKTLYNANILSNTNSDGANSTAFLLLSNNSLYGLASEGGTEGSGTLFALSLPRPNLNIQFINGAVILSWINPGFSLQIAPTVTGVYTNVIGANSPYTNTITSSQRFFRLLAN
jgi:uncharacterized repeat protein (TIGR03803 family)